MLTLIADSGSTKTDWALTGIDPSPRRVSAATRFHTQGINPIHQSDNEIRQILHQELLPYLSTENVSHVYFYGSGVRPEKACLFLWQWCPSGERGTDGAAAA